MQRDAAAICIENEAQCVEKLQHTRLHLHAAAAAEAETSWKLMRRTPTLAASATIPPIADLNAWLLTAGCWLLAATARPSTADCTLLRR